MQIACIFILAILEANLSYRASRLIEARRSQKRSADRYIGHIGFVLRGFEKGCIETLRLKPRIVMDKSFAADGADPNG